MSVRPLLQFLEAAYGAAGAQGTHLPSLDDPSGPLAPFAPLAMIPNRVTDSQSFYQELERAQQVNKPDGTVVFESVANAAAPPTTQAAQNAFFRAYRFYHRPGSQRPDLPEDLVEPSPKPHDFEFHEVLSGLADHPTLLRRLGIVIDLVVELDAGAVAPTGVVRVVPAATCRPLRRAVRARRTNSTDRGSAPGRPVSSTRPAASFA